jgi:DNA-binding NtrC family response regulator
LRKLRQKDCPMLDGAHVLILEDEPIIALDLAATIEAAEGCVVGPAGTVAAALALLNDQEVLGAILDANLPDGQLTPVAILLIERGIPVIIHSGTGVPDELRERYPDVPVCPKPATSDRVIEALFKIMTERRISPSASA